MLITVPMPHEPGSPYPPALPPPLLPKPAKDNLRLQKLLKRTAKKKAGRTTLQTGSFRASLSPVSEASHDQDTGPQPWPETRGAVAPPTLLAPPTLPAPLAPPTLPAPLVPPVPPVPPSPLALPTPPRALVPTSRSPYKPIIQHVSSPLQKKTFSFNLTEQRSLAEHFRMTTPQFGGPGPDTPKALGGFIPVSAPREATHVSRIHIHVQPVLSPRSPGPAIYPSTGSWEMESQERPGDQEEEVATPRPGAPQQPSPMPQIPVAHIQPLTPIIQAKNHGPEPPSTTGLSPSGVAAPKQVITKIVVPIAPTYKSPGPSQQSPLPGTPSAKAEPPPVPPKPNVVYPKFASASDTKQQPLGPPSPSRAFSPETSSKPLVSTVLSPTPSGEGPREVPTPIPKTRFSGWTRLKKQLIVVPEAPPFPEPEGAEAQPEQAGEGPRESTAGPATPRPLVSRATRMWDAVLYRMSVAKGGSRPEDTKEGAGAPPGGLLGRGNFLPFLYRPRFDARKLREMAAQPPTQVNGTAGVNLRPSVAPKNFNRTAACWRLK